MAISSTPSRSVMDCDWVNGWIKDLRVGSILSSLHITLAFSRIWPKHFSPGVCLLRHLPMNDGLENWRH